MAPRRNLEQAGLRTVLETVSSLILNGQLTGKALQSVMSDHFGGSDASGAWSWRMGYDVMQAAGNLALLKARRMAAPDHIARQLLTETRRSEVQLRLQQFSTPLPYAALAARAAMLTKADVVLEPSAGTGTLAVFAQAGKAALQLNEIDPFRAQLLRAVFGAEVSQFDAEHIDDLLPATTQPSVVLMNPPFASSVDRTSDPDMAAKHLLSAAKRLATGGRLVAILPPSFAPARSPAYWNRVCAMLTPRLSLILPGSVYRKLGTSVDTLMFVADKLSADGSESHIAAAQSLKDAHQIVAAHVPPRGAARCEPVTLTRSAPVQPAVRNRVVAAPAKATTALMPLDVTIRDTPRETPHVSDIYARYAPQRIDIAGAQDHPSPLVESLAMASVLPPVPKHLDRAPILLPGAITANGSLSVAQLDAITMAWDAHECDLPGRFVIHDDATALLRCDDDPEARPVRKGFYIGDGTGCGKGRELAGLILANWLAGRQRAVWVSKSADLIEDARRDWADLGGSPADIQPLSRWSGDDAIPMSRGVLFVTYATLRAISKSGRTRLSQILDWLGDDFDGVIGFDEAHAMQNAAGSSEGRGAKPSQQGLAGLRLQIALPRARVIYISATGASQVGNLAYAARLGLWGDGLGYPFPTREAFVSAMEAGGVAAMEVVARDLKSMGLYTARALSFEGVEYDVLEHALSPAQVAIYDTYARAFKVIHANLQKALAATGVVSADGQVQSGAAKASAISRFESTKQRFFNHLLLGMKAPAVIEAMRADLVEGWSCVVQIISTGESLLKRRLEQMEPEDELTPGSLTPRDFVVGYLEQAFPIHAHKLVEIDGNVVAEPLRDENGALVVTREALALRDAAMVELMTLAPIPSALDQILWVFGPDAVAEATGRSIRPIRTQTGALRIEKRSAGASSAETEAFMSGAKGILIFSEAGGTGRSYHAAKTAQNQKRRRHYLLEPGWRADVAIQGMGRTHRSAQVSAPWFRVCTTDVHGEKRFTAAISRRLNTLGALTKGQRETGAQGLFRPEDNLESPLARQALRGLYGDLARGQASSMDYDTFADWTALKMVDKDGVLLEELPPIQRFLNRVLALPIHMQNALFEEFMGRIAIQTERARAAGTLDLGIEQVRGREIRQVSSEDIWTCPDTGAITRIVGLEVTRDLHVATASEALAAHAGRKTMINIASGRVALVDAKPMQLYAEDDMLVRLRKIVRPKGSRQITEDAFVAMQWEPVSAARFGQLWDAEAADLPRTETDRLFLLSGLLLPIWRQIPTENERIYRATPDNAAPLIGRALSEPAAAALRAAFVPLDLSDPDDLLTAVRGKGAQDLGRGLRLVERRVAGAARLEIEGADAVAVQYLKSLGCFTEIIAFQLRVFVPVGADAPTTDILRKVLGRYAESEKAA